MVDLETKIGNLRMRTPLIAVSGIFGREHLNLFPELKGVGAVVTKSVTFNPRLGNPEPRIIETPAGLLNSIGLQNPGIYKYINDQIPTLRTLEVPIIASVAGSSVEEYVKCSSLLAPLDEVDAIELNVSCPNVDKGGMEFGCDPISLHRLITKVRHAVGNKTLIVKLTPNITDIAIPAQVAIDSGVDAISLINTLRGMAIDLTTWKPKLGNRIGGLSGRAIHPIAVYMIYRCYTSCCKKNNVPIIGMGGVSSGEEALELILVGATCVGVGTAMFNPFEVKKSNEGKEKESIFQKLEQYLLEYMEKRSIKNISNLIGKAAAR